MNKRRRYKAKARRGRARRPVLQPLPVDTITEALGRRRDEELLHRIRAFTAVPSWMLPPDTP